MSGDIIPLKQHRFAAREAGGLAEALRAKW
jgi:hypothetical protein